MVLKTLLSRNLPEKRKALEKFLPENERILLGKLPGFSSELHLERFAGESVLEKVHWSWFLPTLKTYPEIEQKFFLSALTPYAAKNLAKSLTLSSFSQEISDVGRSYFRQILLNSLIGPHDRLLPPDYLPPTPLKPLLSLTKKELTRLIDFLSLHDLAAEIRQIVETKILKKIYSLLTEEERTFLKNAMAHKEHFILARMGLDRWDGSEEALRTLLHRRGLARFGSALSGQDPDFIWHVCHQLDIGRGTTLFKLCAKEPIHGVTDAIIKQVEELL
jgi:hypothetical protein